MLEIIWESHAPLGAYDVLQRMNGEGERNAPPTVYRALDFLLKHGLIHRIESQKAFVGCAMSADDHNALFFICRDCGNVGRDAQRSDKRGHRGERHPGRFSGGDARHGNQQADARSVMTITEARRSLVTAANLHLRYGETTILHNVGLDISAGEILTLIGPNGAGKTTLVRVLLGLAQARVRAKSAGKRDSRSAICHRPSRWTLRSR